MHVQTTAKQNAYDGYSPAKA